MDRTLKVLALSTVISTAPQSHGEAAWVSANVEAVYANRNGYLMFRIDHAPSDDGLSDCTTPWVVIENTDDRGRVAAQRMLDMVREARALNRRVSLRLVEPSSDDGSPDRCRLFAVQE